MTKEQLQKERDEWKQTAESLQDELWALEEAYSELEDKNFKLSNKYISGISNLEDFKFRLASENLLTQELEDFIDYYIRFHES